MEISASKQADSLGQIVKLWKSGWWSLVCMVPRICISWDSMRYRPSSEWIWPVQNWLWLVTTDQEFPWSGESALSGAQNALENGTNEMSHQNPLLWNGWARHEKGFDRGCGSKGWWHQCVLTYVFIFRNVGNDLHWKRHLVCGAAGCTWLWRRRAYVHTWTCEPWNAAWTARLSALSARHWKWGDC